MTLLLEIGKRWSKIAKELGSSRTEHMIKNRYKTIISKQKRLFPHIKSDDQLIRFYGEAPTTTNTLPQEQEKEVHVQADIKTEHKSEEHHEQPSSSELGSN